GDRRPPRWLPRHRHPHPCGPLRWVPRGGQRILENPQCCQTAFQDRSSHVPPRITPAECLVTFSYSRTKASPPRPHLGRFVLGRTEVAWAPKQGRDPRPHLGGVYWGGLLPGAAL